MKTSVAIVAAAVVATAFVDPTMGKRSYLQRIPNGSKFTMILGHPSLTNRSTNAFGAQFKALGLNWTLPLCLANYPNTTIMNGAAFGDPCCVWKMGDVPYFNVSNWTDVPTVATKCNTSLPTLLPNITTPPPTSVTPITTTPATTTPATTTPATTTPATTTPATTTPVTTTPVTTTPVMTTPATTKPVTTTPTTTVTLRPATTTPPPTSPKQYTQTQKKTTKPTPPTAHHCNTGDDSDD